MFNTIRGKVTVITISMLITLTFVMTLFSYIFLKTAKLMLLDLYSQKIGIIAQDINKEIMKFENNAKDLALLGELYYRNETNKQTTEQAIIDTFKIYKNSLGGGIWYEPYIMNKNEKRNCIYAFRNKQDKLVLDGSFNSDEYNYPKQTWYKEIASLVKEENDTEWSSPYHEKIGSGALMITVGTGMFDDNGKFIGMSTVDWDMGAILENISKIKPTPNSFSLFADKDNDYIFISTDKYLDNENLVGKSLKNIPWYNDNLKQITYFTYHNKKFIPYVKTLDNNMVLIVCTPKRELFANAIAHVTILFIILIFINMIIAQILYIMLKNSVMIPINKLTTIANKIGKGEEVSIKIENPQDFAHLASTFDKMTKNIKTITKEKERMISELNIAREIQASSLPVNFSDFSERNDLDIYASMTPARNVGGDFYDFYFIDDDNFMFLIADVSGKGIPAALFMMTTKTLIHDLSQKEYEPKELIKAINKEICKNNKQGLFITMLAGIVNIKTGKIIYINCGHNPPLIKTQDNKFEYLALPSNIVLGAFEDFDFEIKTAQLKKGDTIFLYTDGVTEAMNKDGKMYGEEKLLNSINNLDNEDLNNMTDDIKNDVINYCENEPQSDDLTMLIFKFKNDASVKTYKNLAIKDNYKDFYSWLHATCAEWNLSASLTNKIDMCAEEIYANVSFYSYTPPPGEINVLIQQTDNGIILIFEDYGVQYNPLAKPDPDITLPPEERQLGGLGIFMVKEMTDDMKYEYSDGKNRLILTFTN